MNLHKYGASLFTQYARIGAALASDKRLFLLQLLVQAPRYVDALAAETQMSVANASQHLQTLRAAGLVTSERQGNRVLYEIADPTVTEFWLALERVAYSRLADVERLMREYSPLDASDPALSLDEARALLAADEAVVIDVRPAIEFEHGHFDGARSVPLESLNDEIDQLPRDLRIVAYCRGEFCLMADAAVDILRDRGFDAVRIDGGWLELNSGTTDREASATERAES